MKYLRILLIGYLIFNLSYKLSAQWKELGLPYGYDFKYSYIDSKGNIFLEFKDDIYYSDNLGDSWTKTDFKTASELPNTLKGLIELTNNEIWLNKGDDVYKLNSNTKKFELLVKGKYPLINIDHQGKLWYKSNDIAINGFYVSTDLGVTYTYFECPETIETNSIMYMDSYKDDFNILYISNGDQSSRKIYRFTNDGNFSFIMNSGYTPFVYIDQENGTVFTIGEASKFNRSIDGGKTFTKYLFQQNEYFYDTQIFKLYNGDLLLKESSDTYLSNNNGYSWSDFNKIILGNWGSFLYGTSIGFSNSGKTIISTENYCHYQGIYITNDNGVNMKYQNKNLNQVYFDKIVEDKEGNLYAFTCSDGSVLKSTDKGSSWNPVIVFGLGVKDLGTNDKGDLFVVLKEDVVMSSDGGFKYTNINAPSIVFFDGQIPNIYITSNGSILLKSTYYSAFSIDNGNSWTTLDNTPMSSNPIQFDGDDNFYYLTQDKTFIKYDPFLKVIEDFAINLDYSILNFQILENGRIYFTAVDKNSNQFSLGYSDDLMKSFELIPNSPQIINMFSDHSSNLYTITYNGIYQFNLSDKSFKYFSENPDTSQGTYFYLSRYQNLFAFNNKPKLYSFSNNLGSTEIITGKVFNDNDLDCILGPNELSRNWIRVVANGNTQYTSYTGSKGEYTFRLPEGKYDISVVAPNSLWQSCSSTNIELLNNQTDTAKANLGLQNKNQCAYLSVNAYLPLLRSCFERKIHVKYCNEGSMEANNLTLKINLSDKLQYISSSYPIASQNGPELIYDIGNLQAGACGDIIVNVKVNCDVLLGETICLEASIGPIETCASTLPDFSKDNICVITVGSSDPNYKTAYVNGKLTEGKVDQNKDVEYVIQFQNTGNDTAHRVVVIDNIPLGYDISTLKLLNSSHPFNIEIENERQLKFIFDPIALPDSNINEQASHGFVSFKISPNKDLPYGTKLDNYADIYFDFNEAVTTNTAFLTVEKETNTNSINDNLEFTYFPNPTKGELNIQVPISQASSYTISITDLLGKEIISDKWSGTNYKIQANSKMKPGIYFIKVEDIEGKHGYGKFIIQ